MQRSVLYCLYSAKVSVVLSDFYVFTVFLVTGRAHCRFHCITKFMSTCEVLVVTTTVVAQLVRAFGSHAES